MRKKHWLVGLIALLSVMPGRAQDVSGSWEAAGEITFTLFVEQTGDGIVEGRLSGAGMTLDLEGRAEPTGFSGTLVGGGVSLNLTARHDGPWLHFVMVDPELLESGEDASMVLKFRRLTAPEPTGSSSDPGAVIVNGAALGSSETEIIERQYRLSIEPGAYWYDARCGAWGLDGGPTAGFIQSGLPFGGELASDASAGDTGVFVNGREIHGQDVAALEAVIGTVVPGRYWLDAEGNVGLEDGPSVFNLFRLARSTAGNPGETVSYRSNLTGIGAGGSAGSSYVMGKDWAVVVGD